MFLSSAAAETVFDANRTKLQAYLLSTGTFDISGEFSQYDFPDVDTAFDWTFTTPAGSVYQLQGIAPSQNDVFGWKAVSVTPQYTVSSPGSGGIVVQIEQNNGSDYIDFYGDAASGLISKAQGVAAGYYTNFS